MTNRERRNPVLAEIDPEFNNGAPVSFIYLSDEEVSAGEGLALDSVGRTYVVGSAEGRYGIAALNIDGSYVKTFGKGGMLTGSFNGDERSRGYRIATVDDDKLLVLGACGVVAPVSDRSYPALSRYHTTGTLDTSFGIDGYAVLEPDFGDGQTAFLGTNMPVDWCFAHGKIYVVGTRESRGGRSSTIVICVDMEGKVDESFGNSGYLKVSHPRYSPYLRSIVVTDDWIYLAGFMFQAGEYRVVARLNLAGEFDPDYGEGGFSVEFHYKSTYFSLIQRHGNHLLGIGQRTQASVAPMLVGLNDKGESDELFNKGQPVFSDTGGAPRWIRGYVQSQDADGRIVVFGVDGHFNNTPVLARYLSNGELDKSFGTEGTGWSYILGPGFQGGDVVVQSNNDILVVATTTDFYEVVVARYKG